jgi:hypothetical protein
MRAAIAFSCLALALLAAPAGADSRYSCTAGDGRIKLALRMEFSEELGGRLAHFSGALSVLDHDAPKGLDRLRLDSDMLTQRWVDRESIRLRLFDDSDVLNPVYISLGAGLTDRQSGRLGGSYTIVAYKGKEPGFRLEGALACQVDRLADLALADPLIDPVD